MKGEQKATGGGCRGSKKSTSSERRHGDHSEHARGGSKSITHHDTGPRGRCVKKRCRSESGGHFYATFHARATATTLGREIRDSRFGIRKTENSGRLDDYEDRNQRARLHLLDVGGTCDSAGRDDTQVIEVSWQRAAR